jgi:hypothetical protein
VIFTCLNPFCPQPSKIGHSKKSACPDTSFRVPVAVFRLPDASFRLPVAVFRVPDVSFRDCVGVFRLPDAIFRVLETSFRVLFVCIQQPKLHILRFVIYFEH